MDAAAMTFADSSFDVVFAAYVLPAVPDHRKVMSEMVRVSKKYVFCGEYYDTETVEVPYRGQEGALFRRDYKRLFEELFPDELALVREGFLGPEDGWDRDTWWLFERI
jgi:ubiquinone/menaquinone biosynthesis C-methylase UbiE